MEFYGVKGAESAAEGSADRAEVLVNGEKAPTEYDAAKNVLSVCVGLTDTDEKIEIVVRKAAVIPETNDFRRRLNDILMEAEMENIPKMQFGAMIAGGAGKNEILSSALASDMPEEIRGAFAEVLLAE